MDKGYIDFGRLHHIHKEEAFFVTRAKDNFKFVSLSSRTVDKSTGIKCDQTVRLKNPKVSLDYPDVKRRIKYYDNDLKMEFVFVKKTFEISVLEVASLYKYRWKYQLKLKQSQYEILQILNISLLCKIPLLELFSKTCPQYVKEQDCN